MGENNSIVSLLFPGGPDVQQISKYGAVMESQACLINGKSDPVSVPHPGKGFYPNNIFTGPYKKFQIIGMVNHAGMVCILVINLGHEVVDVFGFCHGVVL